MKYIAIIDLGINNLKSIVGAINYFGFKTIITNDKNKIMNASALVLPGVGSFPAGIKKLKKTGLDKIILNYFKKKKPILTICLGFQMLFNSSDEFKFTKGLSLLNGKVNSLKSLNKNAVTPNLGWKRINYIKNKENHLFKKISKNTNLYFIHSYYVKVLNKKYVTSTVNFEGKEIATSIQYKNLYGVQFHPEKSGHLGLQIIRNFLDKTETI